MGGRPRTGGAKPPGAEGSEAPAKRSKAKAPTADAAKAAPAKATAAAEGADTPRKAKAKGKAEASPSAPPPKAPTKAAAAPGGAPAAAPEVAPKAAKAKKPAASIPAASIPASEPAPARKAKGSDALALLDALRRAQGKPVIAPEPAEEGDDADVADDDVDADADAAGEVDPVKAEIVRAPKLPPPFARTSGAPALGFPADKRPAPRWDFAVGKPLTLPLGVRSTGGVGRGVVVELSGAAITDGLFDASELAHDGARARFVRDAATGVLRATLPDAAIPIGVQVPLSPPPRDEMQRYAARTLLASTHVELSIEGQGARVGTALLSVAARPATGTAAPLKWTRPITFR